MSAALEREVAELRAQVDEYGARELADLRGQLADARTAAEHYRREAERNADLGRQIAAQAETKIAELRARVSTLEQVQASVRRSV